MASKKQKHLTTWEIKNTKHVIDIINVQPPVIVDIEYLPGL